MREMGKYIYGVINSNAAFHLFIPNDILEREKNGTEGVYVIPYQETSALVSDTEIIDYTHLRKDALALRLVKHQKVIERIMSLGHTIIPMRLGTYALDETEVKEILNKGYNLIKHIFEKIKDLIEIDVAATWSNFNAMMKEAGEEREVKEFKVRLLANPKGITVDDQMKIGFMLKKVLDDRREEFARRILERLRDLSENTRTHELMDDNMAINVAFLIDKSKREKFDKKVEELNSEFAEKLNFRCVGPLPPYSFYTLEIKKMRFEEIDWARNRLNLKAVLDKEELKKAYQRSAFLHHPDKNPDKPGTEKEFDEVVRAYKILLEYYEALQQASQTDKIHLDEEEYKRDALLVKVKD